MKNNNLKNQGNKQETKINRKQRLESKEKQRQKQTEPVKDRKRS